MTKEHKPEKEPQTLSERFLDKVKREFTAAVGHGVEFTSYEKQLASNMYLMIDASLKEFEAKRMKDNRKVAEYVWGNVNLPSVAVDAVHRVRLGLDALIPNHLHAIPYWNSKLEKYDLDLRVGFRGKDYYRRKFAIKVPKDIRYELVYDTDKFKALKKNFSRELEHYEFEIENPWERGNVVGGFGYIMYEDPKDNKLVTVPESEFKKAEQEAKSNTFWGKWGDRMRYKTLVHRVTDELEPDPEKIHSSYHYVEQQDNDLFDGAAPQQQRQKMDLQLPEHDERDYINPDDFKHGEPVEVNASAPHPADDGEIPGAFDYDPRQPDHEH